MSVTGRNDPCPCGSGRRYKHCHGAFAADGADAKPPVAANDDEIATLVARSLVAHQRGDLDQAERGYRAALARSPEHPTANHYLGVVLYQRGRFDEALPQLRSALIAVPGEPEFHNNLGLVLAALGRVDEAIAAYRNALALKPDHATAWNNLGLALHATRAMPEAIEAFRQALMLDARFTRARWNLALALLAVGKYDEGWREYEARLEIPELGGGMPMHDGPRWDGSDPSGRTILVVAEQGLGDTLQFVRFASKLYQRRARVIVEAPPSLVHLIQSVPGVAQAFAKGTEPPPFDAQVPLSSLPYRLAAQGIAAEPTHYIHAASDRVEAAARRVQGLAGNRLSVGFAWAGNRSHFLSHLRFPPAETFLPLFACNEVAWFSLQKGEYADDFASTVGASALVPLEVGTTFDDDAALIAALDLVISVDTSIAHLSGAMAQPTWVMLPFAADWRWGVSARDSPWYPTARLFRQKGPGDWESVVAAVRDALQERVRDR